MMYEHRSLRLLPWPAFLRRAAGHLLLGMATLLCAVGAGTTGYRIWGHLPWLDAFLNASMILSGMGPVDKMDRPSGKLFAACYALFSGVVFIAVMGVLIAPWAHRLLHRFHVEDQAE